MLKRKKASGIDNLPPGFLKDTIFSIAKPPNHLINLCLSTGKMPKAFKIGKITHLFKNGSKHQFDNERPITVLPICSKVLERCIHSQLMNHLETHKLLSQDQFGFRTKRNTEAAATIFVDSIRKNMDLGKLRGAIFIDLSKVFDMLSHSQIISNLSNYGIRDVEKEFFINYLFDRKQLVVLCGVPQGSVLGPLLFLLSFDDVGHVLSHCNIIMYTDDTIIYTTAKDHNELQQKLSDDFNRVASWLESNDLIMNIKAGKTECMIFGTSQKINNKELNIAYLSSSKCFKSINL